MKLGRLKRHCNDMGTLMATFVKYADSDNTKDPDSDEEKSEKGKKNGGEKGQHHNQGSHGVMVSAKQIIQILWLTPICSVVKVNRPSAVAG